MHTIGFYDTIKECTRSLKNKKNLVVGVLKVYQQLLERCHKTEWKMLINEVANTYEEEALAQQREMRVQVIEKDRVISKLRLEIQQLHDRAMELNTKIYSEQEAFERLHESYLVLQHHNEEGLSLRLQTEQRLKDLFARDRQQQEILKRVELDRKEHRQEARDQRELIKQLQSRCREMEEIAREKDGMHLVIKEEMLAQKRNASMCREKIRALEAPQQMLKDQLNFHNNRANRHEAAAITATLKATSLESLVKPLNDQVAMLTREVAHLKEMHAEVVEKELTSRSKLKEAVDELHEKAEMFLGAEDSLARKDEEIAFIKEKLDKNTDLMYLHRTEHEKAKKRLEEAEIRVAELTRVNNE